MRSVKLITVQDDDKFNTIKKIYYSLYSLFPKTALNAKSQSTPRNGALLRIEYEDGTIGYADCYPWEEFGDFSLTQQLDFLFHKKLTALTKQSIHFAKVDAMHRSKKDSAFLGKDLLCNHLSSSNLNLTSAQLENFRFIKLKFGKDLGKEIEFIKKNHSFFKEKDLKLRLDFNSVLSFEKSKLFFSKIKNELDIIDFVEDPCDFDFSKWEFIQNEYGVSLALDQKSDRNFLVDTFDSTRAFKVVMIKPAIEDIRNFFQKCPEHRVVFTSYMDHPLGQLCALYEAAEFYKNFPEKKEHCGFLTHVLFDENSYSKELEIRHTLLIPKIDLGFGFGTLLEKENWIDLAEIR